MDVRNWPADQLMQLPDHCFGVKREIVLAARLAAAATVFVITPIALPDRCVIWELHISFPYFGAGAAGLTGLVRVKFGDYLPVPAAEYNLLEDVFSGLDVIAAGRLVFRSRCHLTKLRKLVSPQGRRFVVSFENTTSILMDMQAAFVISSIPTEVPDCLISG